MHVQHPGEILLDDFMRPLEISQNALARSLGVSPRRVNEIVQGKRAITAATAVGLEAILGPTAEFWMALQADYDIALARIAERGRIRKPLKHLDALTASWDEPLPPRPKYNDWRFGF
jgi:antitoxin HigA-1